MNKTVLVTGVARGIGRGIAEKFLSEGYNLLGTYYTSKEKADELVTKYGSDRVKLLGAYDFCDLSQVKQLVEELKEYSFDAIVSSAGMFSDNDDFNSFDVDEFTKVMNCNFYAQMIICTELQNNVKNGGSIVLMASNDAYSGAYASMSYTISKASVISLMKCLCVNYGSKNVRVNCVSPGAIDTDMNTPEQMNISPFFAPSGRAGTPNDVAKVVYFLSSDGASFINGADIPIDGGYQRESILLKCEAAPDFSAFLQDFLKNK